MYLIVPHLHAGRPIQEMDNGGGNIPCKAPKIYHIVLYLLYIISCCATMLSINFEAMPKSFLMVMKWINLALACSFWLIIESYCNPLSHNLACIFEQKLG